MPHNVHSDKKAFTLVELMVVIAIIALLTGILMTNFTSARSRGRDAKRVSDMGQIQLALTLFFDRCQQYPASLPSDTSTIPCPGTSITFANYLAKVPTPTSEAGQSNYDYVVNTNKDNYVLHAKLEASNNAVTSGLAPAPTSNANGWPTISFTCDNSASSKDYCLGPNN